MLKSPCKKCLLRKYLAPSCHSYCNKLCVIQNKSRSIQTGIDKKHFPKSYFGHGNKNRQKYGLQYER